MPLKYANFYLDIPVLGLFVFLKVPFLRLVEKDTKRKALRQTQNGTPFFHGEVGQFLVELRRCIASAV